MDVLQREQNAEYMHLYLSPTMEPVRSDADREIGCQPPTDYLQASTRVPFSRFVSVCTVRHAQQLEALLNAGIAKGAGR